MASGAAFTSGQQESLWLRTQPQPVFAQLSVNTSADVCVIGGGLAGVTTAYLLAREAHQSLSLRMASSGAARPDGPRLICQTSLMIAIRRSSGFMENRAPALRLRVIQLPSVVSSKPSRRNTFSVIFAAWM